jgi:hypothetical protein
MRDLAADPAHDTYEANIPDKLLPAAPPRLDRGDPIALYHLHLRYAGSLLGHE